MKQVISDPYYPFLMAKQNRQKKTEKKKLKVRRKFKLRDYNEANNEKSPINRFKER